MSTARSEPTRAGPGPVLALVLACALALTGCTTGADPQSPAEQHAGAPGASPDASADAPALSGLPVARDVGRAFTRVLDQRAVALAGGDRDRFTRGLDPRDAGFVADQLGYFDNVARLPVERLGYELDKASLVRSPTGYSGVVRVTFQLAGFDALPSVTLHRFRFTHGAGERYRVSSVYDQEWETANDVQRQPWETTAIRVGHGPGVLGIFDRGTAPSAGPLLRSMVTAVSDVAARVPYGWDRTVVFYALSDLTFMASLDNLPGDDPDALDGIAFTVPAGPGDERVVATRVAFNPSVFGVPGAERDRLVRHELTHVAVGDHDDFAPTWLSEGLAEWTSVQADAPQDRKVSDRALAEAEAGVETMPVTETFNDTESDLHYAVAWWACEYLAATYGPSAPWLVLDAFSSAGLDERETIEAMLSMSVDALARRGTKLMVTTYDPVSLGLPTEPPTDVTPGTPAVPTDGASPPG